MANDIGLKGTAGGAAIGGVPILGGVGFFADNELNFAATIFPIMLNHLFASIGFGPAVRAGAPLS